METEAGTVRGRWRMGKQQRRLCSLRGINGAEGESGKSGITKARSGINSVKERRMVRQEKDQDISAGSDEEALW